MRLLLLPLVMFITPVALSEDYVWKSKLAPIDYKCVMDNQVGINWDSYGDNHRFLTFKSKYKDIFLTHIANIPITALPSPIISSPTSKKLTVNERKSMMDNESSVGESYEHRTYFIREQDENPNVESTYFLSPSCTYGINKLISKSPTISCHGFESFQLNLETMRFVKSYTGTWHHQDEDSNYAGDSAFIGYGTCSKYFR